MYKTHWGLENRPFRSELDPALFFQSPTHDEALARLTFLVEEKRRLGLLLGGPGSGKSLLLKILAGHLRRGPRQVVSLNLLGMDSHELVWTLADQLGTQPSPGHQWFQLWRSITDRITENRYQRIDTVFLFDDADEAETDALSHVTRLALFDDAADTRLTIVMGANRGRIQSLGPRLLDLSELRIDIESWEPTDTIDYINFCLEAMGREQPAFSTGALTRLHQLTDGVPRRVSQIADLALLAGAGQELEEIDESTIEAVYHELDVTV